MKTIRTYFILLYAGFFLLSCQHPAVSLDDRLGALDSSSWEKTGCDTTFRSCYTVLFPQPLDHHHPNGAWFLQKVYISHRDSTRPVVLVTEGYDANRLYTAELTSYLGANQVIVEHRYFGISRPDSLDWKYLDIYQAAADLHRIIRWLEPVYRGKWVSTGVSKGGQTALFHRYFYPRDVDATVPYVAPLNFSIADPRVDTFLAHVGTARCREKIRDFQKRVLGMREVLYPLFLFESGARGLSYDRVGGPANAFEYTVLEYEFAFWQYDGRCASIPSPKAPADSLFQHLSQVSDFRFFSDQGIRDLEPFFYQAMTQIGFYAYNLEPLKGYLRYVKNPVFTFALPEHTAATFDPRPMEKVERFLSGRARRFIFLYGETDAWSSTAVSFPERKDMMIVYKPGGSHGTRIRTLPPEMQEKVLTTLEDWLQD